jgi:hypothetical protein
MDEYHMAHIKESKQVCDPVMQILKVSSINEDKHWRYISRIISSLQYIC